jgi:hypothetical protein
MSHDHDPNKDIVFMELNNLLGHDSNKGKYSEYVMARILMRQQDFVSISMPNIGLEKQLP